MSTGMRGGILAVVTMLALTVIVPNVFAWGAKELETEKSAATFAREVSRGGYGIVTTDELKKWMDEKRSMLIVDTMPYEDSYKKHHIPQAKQMEFPIPEMKSLNDKTRSELLKLLGPDKRRLIVFYCGFTKCTRSHNAAMWAVKLGYTNVYRHPGGIKGWLEADYPVAKGE
jgi:rhodanese-related sulfurtransferase